MIHQVVLEVADLWLSIGLDSSEVKMEANGEWPTWRQHRLTRRGRAFKRRVLLRFIEIKSGLSRSFQ